MNIKPLLGGCLALALWAGSAPSALAALINVNLTNPDSATSGIGNILTYDLGGGLTLQVTSWSNTGSGGTLAAAATGIWSGGLGVCNANEFDGRGRCQDPNHALDNSSNRDFLLFSFSAQVDPQSVTIGWYNSDSDMNYWIGSETNPALSGLALANLGTVGFGPMFVDNGSGTRTFSVDGGEGFSLLLATELNQDAPVAYQCGTKFKPKTCYTEDKKDYVKVKSIKIDYEEPPPGGDVPEPSTYALVGSALVTVAFLRRKRR